MVSSIMWKEAQIKVGTVHFILIMIVSYHINGYMNIQAKHEKQACCPNSMQSQHKTCCVCAVGPVTPSQSKNRLTTL